MLGRTTIVLLTTAAAAIALPPALDKRCGTTILPSSLYSLQQQFPDQTFPNTPTFLVQQTFDPEAQILVNQIDELAVFTGPPSPGSYGCQLSITFPPSQVFTPQTGSMQLNVYTVPQPLPNPTWNNAVQPQPFLFGTVNVVAGENAVINSEVCPTTAQGGVAFRFSFPEWVTTTSAIGWTQDTTDLVNLVGVYLTYNC